MTPSAELRAQLRNLTDERIPAGGTDADTRFVDNEIDVILEAAQDINEAAAEVWTQKATRAMSERGGLEESAAGDERHRFVKLNEYRDHCLEMARLFAGRTGTGSRVLELDPPDVLGVGAGSSTDLSRSSGPGR